MLRLTETRGSRSWPASVQASRKARICSACWTWNGLPLSSNFSVELCRFMPELCRPVGRRVGRRRPTRCGRAGPSECGSSAQQARAGWGTSGAGWARRSPRRAARRGSTSVCSRAMSASVSPSARRVAEVAPAVDDLLGRAAADAELQPPAGDEVGGAGVLGHVERVLVAHVDDAGADLDPAGPRADGRQQRERRGELAGEVVHAEVGAVGARAPRRRPRGRSTAAARRRPSASASCGEGVQWPKDRKPIFFTAGTTPRGVGHSARTRPGRPGRRDLPTRWRPSRILASTLLADRRRGGGHAAGRGGRDRDERRPAERRPGRRSTPAAGARPHAERSAPRRGGRDHGGAVDGPGRRRRRRCPSWTPRSRAT